jgi:hypothetical protein
MDDLWAFLSDPGNRAILSWIGGGIVIVAGGVWTVFTFFRKTKGDGRSSVTVTADRGGIASGRDTHVSTEAKRRPSDPAR